MSTWMMGAAESSSPQERRAAWERGALLISTSSGLSRRHPGVSDLLDARRRPARQRPAEIGYASLSASQATVTL